MPDQIHIFVIESNLKEYQVNQSYLLNIEQKLGSGSYGAVFDIGDHLVMKLFFHSTLGKTMFEEKECIIPYKNENRELSLYFQMMKEPLKNHIQNHVIPPLLIGYIQKDFIYQKDTFKKNNYFILLPFCIPFHKYYKIKNNPLLHHEDSYSFIVQFMYTMMKSSQYLETKYNIIHLDYKLSNIMYLYHSELVKKIKDDVMITNDKGLSKKEYHENLIVIDFGLVKKKIKNIPFEFDPGDKKEGEIRYYLWPAEKDGFYLYHIPSYSMGINVIELLLGRDKVLKLPNKTDLYEYVYKIHEKYEDIGFLLKKVFIDKLETNETFLYIQKLNDLLNESKK